MQKPGLKCCANHFTGFYMRETHAFNGLSQDFNKPSASFYVGAQLTFNFKVNKENTRRRCEICSKLKIKTPERCTFLLLILNILHIIFFSRVSIVGFEQVNVMLK